MKPMTLQVILKVSERCNLSCTYCYYFYAGDDSFSKRPPLMKEDTLLNVAEFLSKGAADLSPASILIAFHGGEPLLLKPARFAEYCEIFLSKLSAFRVGFQIQTNGVLITDEWVSLFKKYRVNVGVSVDGPEAENDRYRLSNSGEGTYAKTILGLKKLQRGFESDQQELMPSVISVINPFFDYKKIFRHIHIDLKVDSFSFLLPDCQHDSGLPLDSTPLQYGAILCDIFDAWIETGRSATVRQIADLLRNFQLIRAPVSRNEIYTTANQVIVIQSDGDLSIDDTYMVALDWRMSQDTPNVKDEGLQTFLSRPIMRDIDELKKTLPTACQKCDWAKICKGGDLENRYSRLNAFDNPSIFCEGLKVFYSHVVKFLLVNGYPKDTMERALLLDDRKNEQVQRNLVEAE